MTAPYLLSAAAARNPSGASGLMQFMPSTWQTTPYRRRSIWSAKYNALAGGWMHSAGRGNEWSCR
jgi:soluble lytic murein transglycosylase-like protein